MTLLDRTHRFLDVGEEAQADLLRDCMTDGSLEALLCVQLLFEDMYGGMTYNTELKAPAALCLVRWGKLGLEAMLEAVRRTPKVKNRSIALEVLSSVASGQLPILSSMMTSQPLVDNVRQSCSNWPALAAVARTLLTRYVLELPAEDIMLTIGHELTSSGMMGDPSRAREIFEAFAVRLLAVGEPVLGEYEALIANQPAEEPAFQTYLAEHPQLLDPMAIEVWPQPSLWGSKEPDFVIRRSDDTYLVVEIECPAKLLLTNTGQLSADSSHAVHQVLDYADKLVQRQEIISGVFPRFRAPDCLVVNGLEGSLTHEQKRMLVLENAHRRGIRIVGFDWLASRARAIMTGYIAHRVQVSTARLT